MKSYSLRLLLLLLFAVGTLCAAEEFPHTRVALGEGRWMINDRPTNPGSAAEGLLMNVRMVNAVFEDGNKSDFDPAANTDRFIARIPDYAAYGVNAFTICLQGGMPGYEGAENSAFEPDGTLRPGYLARAERVIRACDRNGLVVILGLYYQRQSKVLKNEAAVRTGVLNATHWIQARGFRNVAVEVANEYPHKGFAHPVIRDPKGQASLIRLVRETAPDLLVTASGYGDGKIQAEVAEACDFLTPHWNGTKVEDIPARVADLKRFGKPMVCNEDDKTGERAVAAMRTSVTNGCAYGLMLKDHNQTFPFHFDGAADDLVYYTALKAITSNKKDPANSTSKADFFVSPRGNDNWAGRSAEPGENDGPFATIGRAQQAVRTIRTSRPEVAVQVTLRGGIYRLRQTLDFGPADSGTMVAPVVYAGAKGEDVILSGGQTLDLGAFKPVTDPAILARLPEESRGNVLQVDLRAHGVTNFGVMQPRGQGRPVTNPALELFFNDQPMQLARWPNRGMVPRGKVLDKGGAPRNGDYSNRGGTFTFDFDRPTRWRQAEDIWLSGFFATGYANDTIDVKSIDTEKRTITLARAHRYGLETIGPTQAYYALNLLDEIDEPGEWYLDRRSGLLYLLATIRPERGENRGLPPGRSHGHHGRSSASDIARTDF